MNFPESVLEATIYIQMTRLPLSIFPDINNLTFVCAEEAEDTYYFTRLCAHVFLVVKLVFAQVNNSSMEPTRF